MSNSYLADMVFSAPFYLQNLLDEERYHGYPINDPNGFMESLMLVRWAFKVEVPLAAYMLVVQLLNVPR